MKATIKKKWVAALRSGKYAQAKGSLKRTNGEYCCLGVLTDLYCKTKKVSWLRTTKLAQEILPEAVADWAGLNERNPMVPYKGKSERLSTWNDGGGIVSSLDFLGIAEIIEKSL